MMKITRHVPLRVGFGPGGRRRARHRCDHRYDEQCAAGGQSDCQDGATGNNQAVPNLDGSLPVDASDRVHL